MPQPQFVNPGAPCWIDLYSSDTERAGAFYGALFGWTAESAGPEFGGYITFAKDGGGVAGGMLNDGSSGTPDAWSIYLRTTDAEATAAAAASHGAQLIVPAMQVMELGSMAVVTDPGGAAIGMWQPGLHTGFAVIGEPGTPAWFELLTPRYDESVQFYRDVFGWNTHVMGDTAEFRYTTLGDGDAQEAGIMDAASFLPEGSSGEWSVYFAVSDTDASLAQTAALGGSVVTPAEDTPYGRLATVADPTGAVFKLIQQPS